MNDKHSGASREIKVTKLRNGSVIDHLSSGTAMKVIEILGVVDGSTLAIGMFFESKKMGRKDILKIENRHLTDEEINKIAILSPEATVCTIKDFEVVNKHKVYLPDHFDAIIKCNNPKCITNHERLATYFNVVDVSPLTVRCRYCERAMTGSDITIL